MVVIKEEPLAGIKYGEADALFSEHFNELALNKEVRPLDIDFPKLLKANALDILVVYTARLEGKLIGYASFAVDYHARYKTWKMATNDTVFISKPYRLYRGLIPTFFTEIERLLKERGVRSIVYFDKIHATRQSIFTRFGYKPIEQVYEKVL